MDRPLEVFADRARAAVRGTLANYTHALSELGPPTDMVEVMDQCEDAIEDEARRLGVSEEEERRLRVTASVDRIGLELAWERERKLREALESTRAEIVRLQEANGELVGAALKAASWLETFTERLKCHPDGPSRQDLGELRTAIAKARGEQP